MKKLLSSRVSFGLFAAIALNELLDTGAQYCFKRVADRTTIPHLDRTADMIDFVVSAVGSGYLWIGLFALAVCVLNWTTVLSKLDLSVASPLTSLSYFFVAVASALFLHEHISGLRWLGILFILVGVWIVSSSQADKAIVL